MAEEQAQESYAVYDTVWAVISVAAALAIGFIAADVFTQGAVSAWLSRKMAPRLAAVIPIRREDSGDVAEG